MYSLTINVNNLAQLKAVTDALAGNNAPPEKTLSDFPLQDIVQHLSDKGYTVSNEAPAEPKQDSPQPTKAKSAPKKTKTAPETAETETSVSPEVAEPSAPVASLITSTSAAPEDLKAEALALIMQHYTKPEGKKIATDLLKEFNTRNFHLVEEARWGELHEKTMAAFKAAGLV